MAGDLRKVYDTRESDSSARPRMARVMSLSDAAGQYLPGDQAVVDGHVEEQGYGPKKTSP